MDVNGLAAAVATLGLVVGGPALLNGVGSAPAHAADRSDAGLHLPARVNTPGAWSDNVGPTGPLAALGLALRTRPVGLTGKRQELQLFGVSAVDGRAAWIDLSEADIADQALVGWFALSPNGRWIGWARHEPSGRPGVSGPLEGWAVMDTTTGKIHRLALPATPRLRENMSDLVFSGDSRYLLTSYETPDSPRTRGHRYVAWSVENGSSIVLEEPGHYWLPNPGSAPSGVVWSRGRTVYRADPATGKRSSYSLPKWVATASWAPDDTAFAYIAQPPPKARGPWRLYAGRTLAEARAHAVPLPIQPGELLGWRDDRHVVVGHFRRTALVVDIVSGEADKLDLAGYGEPLNPPLLAADLWQHPLATPVTPSGTTDPRHRFRWGGAVLALLAGAVLLRRRRNRPHPGSARQGARP